MMQDFVEAIITGSPSRIRTSAETSVASYVIAFAAEEARLQRKVIELAEFMKRVRA